MYRNQDLGCARHEPSAGRTLGAELGHLHAALSNVKDEPMEVCVRGVSADVGIVGVLAARRAEQATLDFRQNCTALLITPQRFECLERHIWRTSSGMTLNHFFPMSSHKGGGGAGPSVAEIAQLRNVHQVGGPHLRKRAVSRGQFPN